jgi:hypothetical protein
MAEMLRLDMNSDYRLVASERGCGRSHRAVDRVLGIVFDTSTQRVRFATGTFGDQVSIDPVRSVRLFKGTQQVDCGNASRYSVDDGTTFPIALMAPLTGNAGVFGMMFSRVRDGRDALSVALHGLQPDTAYRIVGSNQACPGPVGSGQQEFRHSFRSTAGGTAFFDLGAELAFASYTHLTKVGAGTLTCRQNIIMANTEGD